MFVPFTKNKIFAMGKISSNEYVHCIIVNFFIVKKHLIIPVRTDQLFSDKIIL